MNEHDQLANTQARLDMVQDLDLRGYKCSTIVGHTVVVHKVADMVASTLRRLQRGGPPITVPVWGGGEGPGTIVLTRTTDDRITFTVDLPDPLPEVADLSDADLVANLAASKQPTGTRQLVLMQRLEQRLGDRVLVDALEQLIEDFCDEYSD